jgi:hypothetical protein
MPVEVQGHRHATHKGRRMAAIQHRARHSIIFGHDVPDFLSYAGLKACDFKACNKAKMSGEDKRA